MSLTITAADAHARRVETARYNFERTSVADLIRIQAVNCVDYYRYKAEGLEEAAEQMLLKINAMGEYIDSRDGTTRA